MSFFSSLLSLNMLLDIETELPTYFRATTEVNKKIV